MQLKPLLVSAFALISLSASAQDKIYKKNGDVLDVKVKEVNTRNISYKKSDNPDGPDYVINRGDVEKIQYKNGSEDYMEERRMRPGPDGEVRPAKNINWGNNIISIAPINIGDEGFGVGLAYERSLDENGYISFYLPVNMVFGSPNDANIYSSSGTPYTRNRTIYQIMPGIKFYPTGNKGKVRYGIGPQLSYETGTKTEEQYNTIYDPMNPQVSSYYQIGDARIQKFGIMVNNSLNMSPNGKIYIGIDLGLGLTYINKMENLFNGDMREQGTRQLAQFNFRIGYRF